MMKNESPAAADELRVRESPRGAIAVPEPIETIEGWYAYHDFRRVDWPRWQALGAAEREGLYTELTAFVEGWRRRQEAGTAGFGCYEIIGHKADLLLVYFVPGVDDLQTVGRFFQTSRLAAFFTAEYSYLSVVELSKYLARGETIETSPHLQSRLHPVVPEARYVSFYPMSKRRSGQDNWYMLSAEERRELMKGHGQIGHHHRSQVTQIITGSQGLDDWEWGVTLFANDPVAFKKIVYAMRFDEASARFAEFGPFYTGIRLDGPGLSEWLNPAVR